MDILFFINYIFGKVSNFAFSMILLLDFGNTRVKVAIKDGDDLRQIYCGPVILEDIAESVGGLDIKGGMWCSVHP